MPDINDLRRAQQAAAEQMEQAATALVEAEEARSGAEEATDELDAAVTAAQAAFDEAEQAFGQARAAVERQERVDAALAASAGPGDQGPAPAAAPAGAPVAGMPGQVIAPEDRGVALGLTVCGLLRSGGDLSRATAWLEGEGHSAISASLNTAESTAGGITIPQAQASGLIEMLRARTVVRRAGARSVGMPAGQLRHARQTSGATASYGAELSKIVESQPGYGPLDMSFKQLRAMVPFSNSLMRYSSIAIAREAANELVEVMQLAEDLAFLRHDGTSNDPIGLRHWALPAQWLPSVGAGFAAVRTALRTIVSRVEDANVAMSSPGWIMRASTKNFLANLVDENGIALYPSIDRDGTLHNYPIHTTSQVPNNLGVGGDETEVYFVDFGDVMIGDSMRLTLATSSEAAFVDVNGVMQSAFQTDQTLTRAIAEHDLAPRHAQSVAGLNGQGWSL